MQFETRTRWALGLRICLSAIFLLVCVDQLWLLISKDSAFSLVALAIAALFALALSHPDKTWHSLGRLWRIVKGSMVTLVSLPILAWLLVQFWGDGGLHLAASADRRLVELLVLILGFAIVVQTGNDLLGRLRKAGPLEFAEKEARATLPRLVDLVNRLPKEPHTLVVADQPSKLSSAELYYFEKANSLVSYLEWSQVDLEKSQELQELVSRIGLIALDQANFVLAIDRFEYLLAASRGAYRPFEIRHRLALANCLYGISLIEKGDFAARGKELLARAISETWKAMAQSGHDEERAYAVLYVRGQAYERLGKTSEALRWYREAAARNRSYAPAVFNTASLLARQGELGEAWALLETLKRDFVEIEGVIENWDRDEDLRKLGAHEDYRSKVAQKGAELRKKEPTSEDPRNQQQLS